jgi:hypothetical protein
LTQKPRSPKGHPASRSHQDAPESIPEIPEPTPPSDDDPKAQADFFLQMLDAFAKANTAETKRIRRALIDAIEAYSSSADKKLAGEILKATMAGIEVGMAEVLRRMLARVRDRMVEESRRLGVSSPEGDVARRGAVGFSLVVDALNLMVQSARQGDLQMRDEARARLAQAQKQLAPLQQPSP